MRRRLHIFSLALVLSSPAFAVSGQSAHQAAIDSEKTAQTMKEAGDSQLPLLSILGMGLLTGGLLSAMRTRPR